MGPHSWFAGALMLAVSSLPARAQPIPQPPLTTEAAIPATVALVETWPDGRVNYELSSPRRASMWTPVFPRVEGYTLPEGARPVYAVQFARVLAGRDIKVDVSVLLGSAQPPGVPVASVVISPGSHVVVEELRKFGVQPVTLSMVTVAPMTPYLPTVVSVSPEIEIANVELLSAPYPGYRITLRNLGSKAVSNVHVQSYRGEEKALSALKRTDDGRPMMQPGASYTFDMNLTSGGAERIHHARDVDTARDRPDRIRIRALGRRHAHGPAAVSAGRGGDRKRVGAAASTAAHRRRVEGGPCGAWHRPGAAGVGTNTNRCAGGRRARPTGCREAGDAPHQGGDPRRHRAVRAGPLDTFGERRHGVADVVAQALRRVVEASVTAIATLAAQHRRGVRRFTGPRPPPPRWPPATG